MTLSLPITEHRIDTLRLFAAAQCGSKQGPIATVLVFFFSICKVLEELPLCFSTCSPDSALPQK